MATDTPEDQVTDLHRKIAESIRKGDSTNWELGELIADLLKVQEITFIKLAEKHGCSEERVRSAYHVFDRFNDWKPEFDKLSWSHFAAILSIDHGEAMTKLAHAQREKLSVAEFKRYLNPVPTAPAKEELPHTFGESQGPDTVNPAEGYAPYRQGASSFTPVVPVEDDTGDAHKAEVALTAKVSDIIRRTLPRITDDSEAAIVAWIAECNRYDQGGTCRAVREFARANPLARLSLGELKELDAGEKRKAKP